MAVKHFIYTGTVSGFNVWGKSQGLPNNIENNIGSWFGAYEMPYTLMLDCKEKTGIDYDDYFAVKRKYTVINGTYMMLRTCYIGNELYNPDRPGNAFMHGCVFDAEPASLPILYFTDETFFKRNLTEDEKKIPYTKNPLDATEDRVMDVSCVYSQILSFVNSEERYKKFVWLSEKIRKVIETDKAHLVFINGKEGKEVWGWIVAVLGLLPEAVAKKCTFDTCMNPASKPYTFYSQMDKIAVFYGGEADFRKLKNDSDTYEIVDMLNFAVPSSAEGDSLAKDVKIVFESGISGLEMYAKLVKAGKTSAEAFSQAAQKLGVLLAVKAVMPESSVIDSLARAASAHSQPSADDVKQVLTEALAQGYSYCINVIDGLSLYEGFRAVIAKQLALIMSDKQAIAKLAALVDTDDGAKAFNDKLKQLTGSDPVKAYLASCAADDYNAVLDSTAKGLVDGDEAAIATYNKYCGLTADTKTITKKRIEELYAEERPSLISAIAGGDAESAFARLAAYKAYIDVKEDSFFCAVFGQIDSEGTYAAIVNGDDYMCALAAKLAAYTCKEKLAKGITAYLCSSAYISTCTDIAADINKLKAISSDGLVFTDEIAGKIATEENVETEAVKQFIVDYLPTLTGGARHAYEKEHENASTKLFTILLDEKVKSGAEAEAYQKFYKLFPVINPKDKILRFGEYVKNGEVTEELVGSIMLADFASDEDYKVTLDYFIDRDTRLAEIYIEKYLKVKLTDSAALCVLLLCNGDVSFYINKDIDGFWDRFTGYGVRDGQTVLARLAATFKKVDNVLKNKLFEKFVATYGVGNFTYKIMKRLEGLYGASGKSLLFNSVYAYTELKDSKKAPAHELVYNDMPDVLKKTMQLACSWAIVNGEISYCHAVYLYNIFGEAIIKDILFYFSVKSFSKLNKKNTAYFIDEIYYGKNKQAIPDSLKEYAAVYVYKEQEILSRFFPGKTMEEVLKVAAPCRKKLIEDKYNNSEVALKADCAAQIYKKYTARFKFNVFSDRNRAWNDLNAVLTEKDKNPPYGELLTTFIDKSDFIKSDNSRAESLCKLLEKDNKAQNYSSINKASYIIFANNLKVVTLGKLKDVGVNIFCDKEHEVRFAWILANLTIENRSRGDVITYILTFFSDKKVFLNAYMELASGEDMRPSDMDDSIKSAKTIFGEDQALTRLDNACNYMKSKQKEIKGLFAL